MNYSLKNLKLHSHKSLRFTFIKLAIFYMKGACLLVAVRNRNECLKEWEAASLK